ncbi:cytochrome P450 [Bradyrhizobium jicamae]|uniref:cytochrome P450 n=1 Tax=Bradyrhizobium jicamae TaxID=280332 RepID=UPI001BA86750|nr:cytochrome P450 [Bradyrhizobium jicamae]MBR0754342.1 cytochrome P450 [Bradyrhizobium jicamae]
MPLPADKTDCENEPVRRQVPSLDVDPFSADYFENPLRVHHELREAGPVVWLGRYQCWAVARYTEVRSVLHDWRTFCSSRGVGIQDFAKEEPWRPRSPVLETDPPQHDGARAVLNRVLSPAVIKRVRQELSLVAERRIDELLQRRNIDAIADLAEAYPLSVFPDLVGMPKEGREHILPTASLNFNAFGPNNELRRAAFATAAPHMSWVMESCKSTNLAPDGFGSQIYAAAEAGEITTDEAALLVRTLFFAGVDTTVNAIGAAIYCLASFPTQWKKLHADPSLARNAFEEAVRYESPVQTFFRTTTQSTEITGAHLNEGEKVLMFLGAANRDPRHWERPDEFDIERRASGHFGFGGGIHMCVGQLLARLEGEVVLSALARRVSAISINGQPKRRHNNTLRGLATLPVTLHAA